MYMASGGSSVLIPARGRLAYREVLVARYIDWLFTTPLLLIDLGMFAGISPMDIVVLVFADVFMIVTGLLGAFRPDLPTRFGFFAISCLFLIWIIAGLVGTGLSVAKARHQKVYQTVSAVFLLASF
jgi:bacteriorhodopsin